MLKKKLKSVYRHIFDRCYNPNGIKYKNYGAKGIVMCNEWLGEFGFDNFYNWAISNGYKYEPNKSGHNIWSIDRIDNNGNYCPENCRWTNSFVQNNNTSRNVLIKYNNKTMTMTQWARLYNRDPAVIRRRLSLGWSIDKALNTKCRDFIQRKTPSRKIAK